MKYSIKNKENSNNINSSNIQVIKQSKAIPFIQRLEIVVDSQTLRLFRYEQLLVQSKPPAVTEYGRAEFDILPHCCDLDLKDDLVEIKVHDGVVKTLNINMQNTKDFQSLKITWLADQTAPIFEFMTD